MEILVTTHIDAPTTRVFDLARDIDLHVDSTASTNERAVAGRTSGLIELNESVTFEARHFFLRFRFTAEVVAFDQPHHFRDVMTKGPFKAFVHDHYFEDTDGGTLMTDHIIFSSPLGLLGALADRLILHRHLTKLLLARTQHIKHVAEQRG